MLLIKNQAGVAIIDKASKIGDTIMSVFLPISTTTTNNNTLTYFIIGLL